MTDTEPKSAPANSAAGTPGSASEPHPSDGIPLPAHGFETLADVPAAELAGVPAVEVITRAAVLLLSSAAEKLGLPAEGEPYLDLDEARRLIIALAGLLAASRDDLAERFDSLRDGLVSLQQAYREASRYPDAPGEGPGESLLD